MEELNPKIIQEVIEPGRKAVLNTIRNEVDNLPEKYRGMVAQHIFHTARGDVEFVEGMPDSIRHHAQQDAFREEAGKLSRAIAPGKAW